MKKSLVLAYLCIVAAGSAFAEPEYAALPQDLKAEYLFENKAIAQTLTEEAVTRQLAKTEINPKELLALQKAHPDTIVIDVRSPQEYRKWHIKGSRNLYLQQWLYETPQNFLKRLKAELPKKDVPIAIYCNYTVSAGLSPTRQFSSSDFYQSNHGAAYLLMEAAHLRKGPVYSALGAQPAKLAKDFLPRSRIAAAILLLNGYKNTHHMETSYFVPDGQFDKYFEGIAFTGNEKPWKEVKILP